MSGGSNPANHLVNYEYIRGGSYAPEVVYIVECILIE